MAKTLTSTFFSPHSDRKVRKQGKRDAEGNPPIPVWTVIDQPPYVSKIQNFCENQLRSIAGEWNSEDNRLLTKFENTRGKRDHSEKIKAEANDDMVAAEDSFSDKYTKDPPVGLGDKRKHWYWIVAAIALAEIFLNTVVFQILGENIVATLLMTIGLALVLWLSAHLLGISLKEGDWQKNLTRLVLSLVLLFVAVLFIAAIAYVRGNYLQQNGVDTETMNSTMTWGFFLLFNLLIFICSVGITYWVHDEILDHVYKARRANIVAEKRHGLRQQAFETARAKREKRFEEIMELVDQNVQHFEEMVEIYRVENLYFRPDRGDHPGEAHPKSFINVPIDIPATFVKGLDWPE